MRASEGIPAIICAQRTILSGLYNISKYPVAASKAPYIRSPRLVQAKRMKYKDAATEIFMAQPPENTPDSLEQLGGVVEDAGILSLSAAEVRIALWLILSSAMDGLCVRHSCSTTYKQVNVITSCMDFVGTSIGLHN